MASRITRSIRTLLALVLVVNVAACGNDSQDPTSSAESCLNCAVIGSTGGGSNVTPNTTGGAKPASSTTGGNTSAVTTNVAGMPTTGGSAANATGGTGSVTATGGSSTTTTTATCKDQGSSCSLDSDCCQSYGPGTVSCQLSSCRMVAPTQTGGASSTGGKSSTGGSTSVVTTTGGKSSTGGSSATGSVTSTTGGATVQATGGKSSTGGTTSVVPATGGTPSTGGSSATSCLDQGSPCINDSQCCQSYGPGTVSCQLSSCRMVAPTQTGGASSTGGTTSVGSAASTGGAGSATATGGTGSVTSTGGAVAQCVPSVPAFKTGLANTVFAGITSCTRDVSFQTAFTRDGMTTNVVSDLGGTSLTDMYVASFDPNTSTSLKHKTVNGWEQVVLPMPADYDTNSVLAITATTATSNLVVAGGAAMILNGQSSTAFWLKQNGQWTVERIPNIPDGSGQVKSIWTDGTTVFAIVRRDIVGNGVYEADDIYIRTADGRYVQQQLPAHTSLNLSKIDGRSAKEVYAVGDMGMYHYDGCTWTLVSSLNSALTIGTIVDISINDQEILLVDSNGYIASTKDLWSWKCWYSHIPSGGTIWSPGPGSALVTGNSSAAAGIPEAIVLSNGTLAQSAVNLNTLIDPSILYITDLKKIQDKIVFVGYNGFDGVAAGYVFICQ